MATYCGVTGLTIKAADMAMNQYWAADLGGAADAKPFVDMDDTALVAARWPASATRSSHRRAASPPSYRSVTAS